MHENHRDTENTENTEKEIYKAILSLFSAASVFLWL